MQYRLAPLFCRPWALNGITPRLIESHYERNYGGELRRLNAISEELAALDPELSEALFGTPKLPFSVTLDFPVFAGPDYARAVAMARSSADYREVGAGERLRHRARFYPKDAIQLRDLFALVGQFDATDVLIDDRPVPYARELWLPLIWFLIR